MKTEEKEFKERWRYSMTTGKIPIDEKMEEPIIKIYVETPMKLESGNIFVVNNIRDKFFDNKEQRNYVVELVKTTVEDQIDEDYLYEWARDNYQPEPDDSSMDRD